MKKEILIVIFVISLASGVLAFAPQPGSPMANHEHPRMHITKQSLPELRNIIKNYYSTEFKAYVKNRLTTEQAPAGDSSISEAREDIFKAMMLHQAFIGLLNLSNVTDIPGIAYKVPPENYSRIAINSLLYRIRQGDSLGYVAPLVYDWTYHLMTPEERKEVALYFKVANISHIEINPLNEYYSVSNPILSSNVGRYSSHYFECNSAFYVALAIWGDGYADAEADRAVDSFYTEMLNYGYLDFQNFIAGDDGGYSEWAGYSRWHPRTHYLRMDAWRTATGEDYLSRSGTVEGNAIKNFAYLATYTIDPFHYYGTRYDFMRSGSASVGDNFIIGGSLANQLTFVPGILNRSGVSVEPGLLRRFAKDYQLNEGNYVADYIFSFLGSARTIEPISPEQLNLPKSKWFMNAGAFYARTGFSNESDGVFVASDGHFNYDGHGGMDDYPGFALAKFGELVNERECCSKGRGNLDDYPGAYWNNVLRFQGNYILPELAAITTSLDLKNIIDGVRTDDAYKPYDLGGIEQVTKKDGEFYYVRTNRSLQFISGYSNTRDYVWIPGRNPSSDADFLIIYDRSKGLGAEWVFHVPWEPDVSNYVSFEDITTGNNFTSRLGKGYEGSEILIKELNNKGDYRDDDKGRNNFTGGSATINIGTHGVAFAKTLLPKQERVEVSRVADFDSDVFAVQGAMAIKEHRWQVSVFPQDGGTDQRFLHVFETGDANLKSAMVNTELIETPETQGVFITRENAGRPNYVVLFTRKEGINNKSVSYTINGNGETKHVITGLKPRTYYEIRDNGVLVEKKLTEGDVELWDYKGVAVNNETGVLYFTTQLGSEHTITISEGALPSCLSIHGDICSSDENCMNGNINLGFTASSDSSRCCTAPGNCTIPPKPNCNNGFASSACLCGSVEINQSYCCSGMPSTNACVIQGNAPLAPSGLIANLVNGVVHLTWIDNSNNEDEFIIEKSLNGADWSEVDRVGVNVTGWEDTGALLGSPVEEKNIFETILDTLGNIFRKITGFIIKQF